MLQIILPEDTYETRDHCQIPTTIEVNRAEDTSKHLTNLHRITQKEGEGVVALSSFLTKAKINDLSMKIVGEENNN